MYSTLFTLILYFKCVQCANILGVFMFPSISHQIVFQSIWRELSLRGHQVTVVTPDPLDDSSLTNLTEISVRDVYKILKHTSFQNALPKDANIFTKKDRTYQLFDILAAAELNSTQFQKLIHEDKKYDLILIQWLHPAMYALSEKFKSPIISISTHAIPSQQHNIVGNPNHPALYPDIFHNYGNKDLSLWQKIRNLFYTCYGIYYHEYVFLPRAQKTTEIFFGNAIPYIGNLEREFSMFFINTDPVMYSARATIPAFLEMGGVHLKPKNPLPKDIQKFLDEAEEGAVYFSLGTNVKTVSLDKNLTKIIIEALSELPYKVILKWESDHLPNKPPNVITRKWLPQQDLLYHPHIRAFVTQGGLQSIEEAVSRGVPLIGLPFISDQAWNVNKIVDLGIGIGLNPVTLTKEELKKSIIEVSKNNFYKERIRKIRGFFFDKPMTGLERAVWWSEYVIRHKGAPFLKNTNADISWFNFLMLDVLFSFIVGGVIITCGSYKIARFIATFCKIKILQFMKINEKFHFSN